jgi:glutaryl-CoA dehydrogenase (non-decarboxylating)
MTHLNHTRLACGAGAVGVARAAREAAVSYANQREQFGQKIGQFQMNQDLIAQMVVHEEGGRALVYRAAALADRHQPHTLETTIAKYAAAEAAAFWALTVIPPSFRSSAICATPSLIRSSKAPRTF